MIGDFRAKEEKMISRMNMGKWVFQEDDLRGDFLAKEERRISRANRGKF